MTLAALDPTECPDCGQPLIELRWGQPALFYFGGYGETRTTTVRACPCGWRLLASVTSVNPRGMTP